MEGRSDFWGRKPRGEALCQTKKGCKRRLDLGYNAITKKGGQAVLDVLRVNSTLTTLLMGHGERSRARSYF